MKNTCLHPFYEYILKNWIHSESDMPEYNDRFRSVAYTATEGESVKLAERKKDIWENTRLVLRQASLGQWDKLQELSQRLVQCDLCFACQKCEEKYWEALKGMLLDEENHDRNLNKSDFLIPDEMKELLRQKERPVDIYIEHYRHGIFDKRNILVMLKGFSSSTPILLNYAHNTNFYSGGGFYIRWNGVGIAIDPGYLFVQNLQDYGLSVLDIDVVIITHEHIDHASDMRILDDLHYNVSSNYSEKIERWDEKHSAVSRVEKENHKIKWYMDSVTCEEAVLLAKKKSGFDKRFNQLYCINIADEDCLLLENKFQDYAEIVSEKNVKVSEEISLHVFQTAHEQYKEDGDNKFFLHTYGCVFECGKDAETKRVIGYTSDTSLQNDIYPAMRKLMLKCHVIIANISGIYRQDILLRQSKPRHLGYSGCYRIVEDLIKNKERVLKYFLISEFSNQVSDIRFGVSKYLQDEVNELARKKGERSPSILPTEIALTLDVDTFCVRCSICGKYAEKIHVLRPHGENNKMQYVCSECMYSGM